MTAPRWHVPFAEIMADVACLPPERRFTVPLRHGTMSVEVYAPLGEDRQSPHSQDELYIVISGTAEFVKAGTRIAVQPQDLLFVEAGVEHRFVDFSADFATWVVFWGPEGGER
jgi:mannose-6-phosphate isomerase-like protein (cupin superfamily)